MTKRLRILLDTNILLPLQDSMLILQPSLANFVRLASVGGHQLLYHPASKVDIERDKDSTRRTRTLTRLKQYSQLDAVPESPLNTSETSANDACDNNILHALECSAVHALVTEDKEIHRKAKNSGFGSRVFHIQTAENWLSLLHEPREVLLPNIEDVPMYSLTNQLDTPLFDSLRSSYDTPERSFNTWFSEKAAEGRKAWIARTENRTVEAICIYVTQKDERINDQNEKLRGRALKLCTFKVGEKIRGRKIGELFLKAAFRFATENQCENIFVHTSSEQVYLLDLLFDFGFQQRGMYGSDIMLVKAHPITPPNHKDIPALDYAIIYYPHYKRDINTNKFIIPIKPKYHEILFPELTKQGKLFSENMVAGNAIKQAYLCKANTKQVAPGDIIVFYCTEDIKAVTTLGIVERYETHSDPASIMQIVRRRTVYSQADIELMANSPTKVMLFRIIMHFHSPIPYEILIKESIVLGPIQSITKISDESFAKIISRSY